MSHSLMQRLKRNYRKLLAADLSVKSLCYELSAMAVRRYGFDPLAHISSLNNHRLHDKNFQSVCLEDFKVTAENFFQQADRIKSLVKQQGVCVIEGLADRQLALDAGATVSCLLEKNQSTQPGQGSTDGFAETADYFWQTDACKFKNYQAITQAGKPVINIRSKVNGKPDAGMVDIFDIEQLAKLDGLAPLKKCCEILSGAYVVQLMRDISGYQAQQMNLYYNAAVSNPRGPHIDNNKNTYKIFLYLSDVLTKETGPYCYVPGSHQSRGWMSKERWLNSIKRHPATEVSSLPRDKTTQLFGQAGTGIITCQSGIHCGWPQGEKGRRTVLIGNYF